MEDSPPPLITPACARLAAWVMIACGLLVIFFAPGSSPLQVVGGCLVFSGLGTDWRSRCP